MVGTNPFPFSKPRKTPWTLRSSSKSITQEELAKRPDPFFLPYLLDGLEDSKYGWLADDVKRLCQLKHDIKDREEERPAKSASDDLIILSDVKRLCQLKHDIKAREEERPAKSASDDLIILSDDELPQESVTPRPKRFKEVIVVDDEDGLASTSYALRNSSSDDVKSGNNSGSDTSLQGDDEEDSTDDDNQNPLYIDSEEEDELWRQMAFAQESIQVTVENPQSNDLKQVEDCDHSFIYKDDVGEVCRVCGLIKTPIERMIEVVFNKPKRSRRSYMPEKENGETSRAFSVSQYAQTKILGEKMFIHARHEQNMRPHQADGFRFLCNNLAADEPGGCILAHAPGSGKTFLLISFLQSFMAMDPQARPLIVLPKGIIDSWKREFASWGVEDIPLLDFYSVKAESREQQLKVLGKWVEQKSILFVGYHQFARIICDDMNFEAASEDCRLILLEKPTLLILDEGHTSRNKETYMLHSLARVRTPRKVVLTGTLFQNNVKEVFNILDLVRPNFLKLPRTREIVTRFMSKAEIPSGNQMNPSNRDANFFAAVELTLQKSLVSSAKASLIKDLRETTCNILHYHKADFSGLLPPLSEFTVMLNLSLIQRDEVEGLRKMEQFKQISLGAALYIHPKLKSFMEENPSKGEKIYADNNNTVMKIDEMLKEINVRDGVKMKFFLNLIALCESTGEKLLVFSQYIVPIKTLERLMISMKGWHLGKEMFTVTGDSSNEQREWSMKQFNNSPEAKVFFGSIKACGEGISLVGASRVLILDVHLNPSVTQQAVARAHRPGQKRKVYAYRLVAADSPEEENYEKCTRKEMISKLWFEWSVGSGRDDFGFRAIDVDHSGDAFLETTKLKEDVKCLYTR